VRKRHQHEHQAAQCIDVQAPRHSTCPHPQSSLD
jgi:hypothetical protein